MRAWEPAILSSGALAFVVWLRFANENVRDGQVPRDHSEVRPQAQAQLPAVRLKAVYDLEHAHSVFACLGKRGFGGQLKQARKLLMGLFEACIG
jgi:hypothetical protein